MTLYDTDRAAHYLDLKRRTLERWRCEGIGPRYRKIGRLVRYTKDDLDEYLEQQIRTSTSQEAA